LKVGEHRIMRKGALAALAAIAVCIAVTVPAYATWTDTHNKSVTLTPAHTGSVTAVCPAGERAAAGGIGAPVTLPLFLHEAVFPQGMFMNAAQTGWAVTGSNGGVPSSALTARVYCNKHGLLTVVSKKVTAPIHHKTTATATCPAGKFVLAAGFSTPATANARFSPNAMLTHLRATAGKVSAAIVVFDATTTLTAIAYCGTGPAATEKAATANISFGSGVKMVVATCPSGTHFMFGGVDGGFSYPTPGPQIALFSMSSPSIGKWQVSGFNTDTTAAALTAYAYCR
jgi:hypothetical protein